MKLKDFYLCIPLMYEVKSRPSKRKALKQNKFDVFSKSIFFSCFRLG